MTVDTLREVVEALAPLERRAGSIGEQHAAEWLAARLTEAGARDARVEPVPFRTGYALRMAGLTALGAFAARRGHRLLGALAAALIVDDASNGPRVLRNLTPPQMTQNVIAETGGPDAEHTLVVVAHHDAAPTGFVFDQRPQQALANRFPELVARTDTSFPLWWLVAAGPTAAALGLRRLGFGLSAFGAVSFANIASSPVVPGANDNLSACAALVALAERGADLPVRVLLVSCGAEEVVQGGIYPFVDDHLRALDPAKTSVLILDTIGSPELFLLEGEGTFVMEDYCEPAFRDRVAAAAERVSGPLRRGCRARSSTDAVIPSRAGYPTAALASWEPFTKCLTHYHQMTDLPEHLSYDTIARAVDVTAALAEDLAGVA